MNHQSKAQTLKALEGKLVNAIVLPQFCFSLEHWLKDDGKVLDSFFNVCDWAKQPLIIRSSGNDEDQKTNSLAGAYHTELNVQGEIDSVYHAVLSVIKAFSTHDENHQIFIQPMLNNVVRSGVVFTRDLATRSPYYVINFSRSDDTTLITSGTTNEELIYIAKSSQVECSEKWTQQLIELCLELEGLLANDCLDIEFAFDKNDKLYLFQVRSLVINNDDLISLKEHEQFLKKLESTVNRISKPHPYLSGDKAIFGIMPDWNPAEIIGVRPRPLALSLYQELVTDSIWAYQRDNYGYKNLRSFPLMVNFSGLPYIDVRVSFNSFIPADISTDLANKLVNYYLNRLISKPNKHDKIEFDVIFSCFTFDTSQRIAKLKAKGFTGVEIRNFSNSLKLITNNIINADGLWVDDLVKISELPQKRKTIIESELTVIEKVYWLLEDCKRYGTLPFAGLARAGFIAVQFLKSMVAVDILSQEEYDQFMRSLNTVSSTMAKDRGEMPLDKFMSIYGHLRPGTYDILSPRYDQAPEQYFDHSNELNTPISQTFKLSDLQVCQINTRLKAEGLAHNADSLFFFIKRAIEGREQSKFIFSQSLSDVILLIEKLGNDLLLSKDDMSYLDISSIYNAYSSSEDIGELVRRSIANGKVNFRCTKALVLPSLIVDKNDVYNFSVKENEPNFITLNHVIAETTCDLTQRDLLKGKIVFIPSADPGFDWLFSLNIAGLITLYGGANSHMAIRASEMGIPSVIGAGELLYHKWQQAKCLALDAANRKVSIFK
jgi:phosphohistidine swiveling domain-containing protein